MMRVTMNSGNSISGMLIKLCPLALSLALSMILPIALVSGCSSVISNSESFYEKIPRRPINWREYLTD